MSFFRSFIAENTGRSGQPVQNVGPRGGNAPSHALAPSVRARSIAAFTASSGAAISLAIAKRSSGVAVDTLSLDHGGSKDFAFHLVPGKFRP